MDSHRPRYTLSSKLLIRLVFTLSFWHSWILSSTFISLHWLHLKKSSVFKGCILMFEKIITHSTSWFFKLPFSKGLRSTYSHFSEYLSLVLMLNLNFLTVGPFYGTLFLPISPLLLLFFHFVKPSKLCCSNCSCQSAFVESALYKWLD